VRYVPNDRHLPIGAHSMKMKFGAFVARRGKSKREWYNLAQQKQTRVVRLDAAKESHVLQSGTAEARERI
jgi:hypothetical protein